jgi:hypothetical protein
VQEVHFHLKLKWNKERKMHGVPIDDPGDVDSDMMQEEY